MLRRAVLFESLLMIAVMTALVASLVAYNDASARANRAQDELVDLYALRVETLDIETGLRGYFIVEREEFLEPYRQSIDRVDVAIAEVARSFPGDPRVERIRELVTEWRNEFAEQILLFLDEGRRDDAAFLFGTGEGKRRIDAVRDLIGEMATELRERVARREDELDRVAIISITIAAAGGAAFIAVSWLLVRRLDRTVTQPMGALVDTAERLGTGDLAARSSTSGLAEVDAVAVALDDMAGKLEATVEELRSLDRLKSEFVSVVSHELRTPLTSIRGSLGLLHGGAFGELPPDAGEMLNIAVANTDRLIRLINDILDLERIAAGREAFDPHHTDASELIRSTADNISGIAGSRGVEVIVGRDAGALLCDRDRIVQALTNLAGNAIKFSDPGDRVWLESEVRGNDVVFEVRDEGRGIPEANLESIFERFSQVDASDARERGGTGLGLAIVKSIAERHGGRVDVTSLHGQGSTFSMVLPAVPAADLAASSENPEGGPLVLVVEDDADLRRVMRVQLAQHGLRIAEAGSVREALERCEQAEPDLLVLDVRLGTNGDEHAQDLVSRLRAHDRLRSLPTVIYTAYPLTDVEISSLRLGETRILPKEQASSTSLEDAVVSLLAGQPGERRARPRQSHESP